MSPTELSHLQQIFPQIDLVYIQEMLREKGMEGCVECLLLHGGPTHRTPESQASADEACARSFPMWTPPPPVEEDDSPQRSHNRPTISRRLSSLMSRRRFIRME